MSTEILERRAIISGIGQSDVGRRLNRDGLDLTIEAALAAISDAGLSRDDIDGLCAYPGNFTGDRNGFSGPGTPQVQDALRLNLNWHSAGNEGPGQLTAVFSAIMAVACGLARHVLVYRTVTEGSAGKGIAGAGGDGRVGGFSQWLLPYGAISSANWAAMYMARHMHEFGTTREQFAQLAVNDRRNAARNPKAVYTEPMTVDDYLNVRMISAPLCLYDCDAPCDGSTAFVVSAADHAADLPHVPVRIQAIGAAIHGRPQWDLWEDLTTFAMRDAAAQMWSRTDLKPADVDVAQLYDGFSVLCLTWLEALGFCGRGEGGPFVEGGTRIAGDGELPLNTHGGQLSGGRLHGFGFLHEACLQVRGEAGERQVPGVDVAVAGVGGGPVCGSILVTR